MLGVAMRIAQRMGLHNESSYAKCSAFEAEMRRRLWWSLVLFDTRICELVDFKIAILAPTWDCRTPLSLNDFDLRPEMKDPGVTQEKSSEAIFAVMRSEIGDIVRHSAFHLDFVNPALKSIARDVQSGRGSEDGELVALEKMIEDKYLRFCDSENPLHFMTIWTARGHLAKNRLLEHYSRFARSSAQQQVDVQRDRAISYARNMLECDTNIMTSTLTKGYLWFVHFYFPLPAYIHILQDLRMRPVCDHAEQTWEIMSDNYRSRFPSLRQDDNPLFKLFSRMILRAWEAREAVSRQSGEVLLPPRIVSDIKRIVAQLTQDMHDASVQQPNDNFGINADFSMPMSVDSGLLFGMEGQGVGSNYRPFHNMPRQAGLDVDLDELNWTAMDWNPFFRSDW